VGFPGGHSASARAERRAGDSPGLKVSRGPLPSLPLGHRWVSATVAPAALAVMVPGGASVAGQLMVGRSWAATPAGMSIL
jgi:hypothetical protein